MGIGNDIKPKKVYRYKPHQHDPFKSHHHNEHKKVSEDSAEQRLDSEETTRYNSEKTEDLEDDFFHDYNETKPKTKKVKEEHNSDGFLFQNLNAKNVTWLLIIALAIVVLYQNFESIKGLFVQPDATSKNSNSSDEYYEGTTSKNSNLSTLTNSNINENTNLSSTPVGSAPAAIDKSSIILKVLNGNGIAGSADTVSATLKAAGFSPAKSANARKFTYPESIIYYKTGQEEAANLVEAALPELVATIENSDSVVGTFDVIVVVGKK